MGPQMMAHTCLHVLVDEVRLHWRVATVQCVLAGRVEVELQKAPLLAVGSRQQVALRHVHLQ